MDVIDAAGLLTAEIVRGHADHHQAALSKAGPELLQAGILRRVAAQRGGVDDEDRFAGVVGEPDVAAMSPVKENA